MLRRTAAILGAALLVSTSAFAQGKAEKKEVAAEAPKASADGVKRDPKGIIGISPFWEGLKKGDDLYVARDFDGAITAYKDAITKEPQNAMGHYRIGEAYRGKNQLSEAEASWVAALRYVGNNGSLKAKILFVLADLRERQKSLDDATDRWNAYLTFAKQAPAAKTYPASAEDRKKRIAVWKKMKADYAAVRKRIEKRLKEVDAKAKRDAKKKRR